MHSSNHAASEKAIVTGLALRMLSLFHSHRSNGSAQAQTDAADSQAPAVRHNSWSERAAMPTALKFATTGVIGADREPMLYAPRPRGNVASGREL